MPNFPKKQQQCLIPKYLLDYATDLQENHPDPSAEWGGGGGGTPIEAGEGIVITGTDTKTISVDTEDVAMVSSLSGVAFSGSYNDLSNTPTIPDAVSGTNDGTYWTSLTIGNDTYGIGGGSTPSNMVTTDTAQRITGQKSFYNSNSYSTVTMGGNVQDESIHVEDMYNHTYIYPNKTIINDITLESNGDNHIHVNYIDNYDVESPFHIRLYDQYNMVTGSYDFAKDKQGTVAIESDIPTNVSELYNDSGYITGISSLDVTTALGYTPYDSSNPSGYITSSALAGYATESWVGQQGYLTSVTWNDVSGKPTFATVATSGDYDDLLNKPTIPTDTSDLTNGAGYITGITSGMVTTALGYTPGTSNFSGNYNDLSNKPTIPSTATSTSTSTVTPSTTSVVSGVTYTPATETLVFTYTDNTTATITLLTSSTTVTPSTATVMTGATVSTTTTTTLS